MVDFWISLKSIAVYELWYTIDKKKKKKGSIKMNPRNKSEDLIK